MFKNTVFLSFMLCVYVLSAQNDSIKKNYFDTSNRFQIDAKLINKNIEIDEEDKQQDISYLFYTKKSPLRFEYKSNPKQYLNPTQKNVDMRNPFTSDEDDEDVMVVKHFNGKNTTKTTMKTTQNLGTIESNTKYVRIEYRDFGLVDGDRVRVFLNEKEIDSNVHLDGLYYTLHIKLDKKGYNRIDIQAINQGYVGPNTAEFIIYDDKGNIISHKTWLLKTGQNATLGIVRY